MLARLWPPDGFAGIWIRRGIALALAAVTIGLVISLAGGPASRSFGPCTCAGYRWFGPVTSVSATWRIPTLTASTLGFASTWVGVQTGGPSGPFIQIGINEGRLIPADDAKLPLPPAAYPSFAFAFWSDTVHDFRSLPLGAVQTGDVVHASLTLAGGRWRLRLADPSSLVFVGFSTRDEGDAPLGSADWLQEDVLNTKTNRLYPYPRLSPVDFRELRVNGAPPSSALLSSLSMSTSANITVIPGPLDDDAFTVDPAR